MSASGKKKVGRVCEVVVVWWCRSAVRYGANNSDCDGGV